MSKQSEARQAQGYNPKPCAKTCGNCVFYKSDIKQLPGYFGAFQKEKNIRCWLGGFAVKKTATCDRFQERPND